MRSPSPSDRLTRSFSRWLDRRTLRRALALAKRTVRQSILQVTELEDRVVPTLIGQQLFPTDNPWNQNISSAPVAANSAAIISHIGASVRLHPDWGADSASNGDDPLYGIPVNIVHGNSTAKVNVTIDNYPGESDVDPVPIPANAVIEGDYQGGPNPNGGGYNSGQRGDSHFIIWDEDTNIAYELYGVTRPSDSTLFPNTSGVELPHTDGLWHAAQETVWNMNTDTFRAIGETSADAAGLSILAGLVRPDEGLPVSEGGQGAIDHALRVTLPSGDVDPQYIYPASHMVSTSQGADNLPLGGRMRLADTPAIDTLIDDMPPESQIIARAMQQYGLIVADIGSAMYVTGSSATVDNVDSPNLDLTWDLNDIFAYNGLEALNAGDFQVVNLTPTVTSLSTTTGTAGSTVTIDGQNFSGAAGHLSVLFGNTPATSVTFVSDSQLTAVVPSGSGTVDVSVQSGVDEVDNNSSNPDANVTQPVFGYGISARTTADQFSYSNQTISGSNSSVGFASPSVTSGSNDLLTIVVKDASGNAVTGLTSAAFSFSLSGGVSHGTFGSVTASATPGTYTTVFTGTTSGTTSTLTVTVGSVTLTTRPTVQVGFGSVSVAKSTINFATPTVAAGGSDLVTIVVQDSSGNAITGLASSVFNLSLGGGTSTGTFATVTPSSTPGTYTAAFTGIKSGTVSTLAASIGGTILATEPTVEVSPGAVSATTSTVSLATGTLLTGQTDLVTLVVKDGEGNAITGLASGTFHFALTGGSGAGTLGTVAETTVKGTYSVLFTGTTTGTPITLTTTINGVTLTQKPTITVTAGSIPIIALNPISQTVNVGSSVTFTAGATGNPSPTVQWQISVGSGAYVNIPGATAPAYSFSVGSSENGNQYRAVFTNSAGQAITSAAALTAKHITIGAGQQLFVKAGQTVTGVTILKGGDLVIQSGGTDVSTINEGGVETVEAGGLSIGATIDDGGDMEVFGKAIGLTNNDGTVEIHSEASSTNAVINGGTLAVVSGGVAINTTINKGASATIFGGGKSNGTILGGGDEYVRSNGQSDGTTVDLGGLEYVFAGGVAEHLTVNNGGNASILGNLNGATISPGATITIYDGGSATGSIDDNGSLKFQLSSTNTFTGQVTGNGTLGVAGSGNLRVANALNNLRVTIGNSSTLEIETRSNAAITLGYQSKLKLDDSRAFTGTIAATSGYEDSIDLGDVPFVLGGTTVHFAENSEKTQGVLTVGDPAKVGPSVTLILVGDFGVGTFTASADGKASSQNPHPGSLLTGPF